MEWWIWLLLVGYIIIGSIVAKIARIRRWGEDDDFLGGPLDERVSDYQVSLFLCWLPILLVFIIIAPFLGIYKLVSIIWDKIGEA